jgi:hypothetical protein
LAEDSSACNAKSPVLRKTSQFVTETDRAEQETPKKECDQGAGENLDSFKVPPKVRASVR